MLDRELVEHADDLVLHPAQPRGAAAAMTILKQQAFDLGAARGERRLELQRDRGAQLALVAGVGGTSFASSAEIAAASNRVRGSAVTSLGA